MRCATALARPLPARRLGDPAPDPQGYQCRQHADQIHPPPCVGADPADRQPDAGGENAPEPGTALQEAAALPTCVIRPQLGDDGRSGRPFRADRGPDEKAQHGEGHPIPGERAEPGRQRIGEDGQDHRPLAADIVGDDAADHTAGGPAEDGGGEDVAGVTGNGRVLGRVEQLVQSEADGEEQRIELETVEQPAEVRGDQHPPLRAIERAIPR